MAEAKLKAAQYDYDGAMELLKSSPDYESNTEMQQAVTDYAMAKNSLVEYPIDQVTHVFFHSMIVDTNRAFGKRSRRSHDRRPQSGNDNDERIYPDHAVHV